MTMQKEKLGKLCKLYNGRTYKASDWRTEGIPIIRIQNLKDATKSFNYWAKGFDGQIKVNTGDLLLAWSGTPGTSFGAHIWNGPIGVLNQHIFRVDLDPKKITKEWAMHSINAQLDVLIGGAQGGVGLKHVTKSQVESLDIPTPPIEIQNELVGRLSLASNLKEMRKQTLEGLDEYLRSLFIEMFGDPVTNPFDWKIQKLKDFEAFLTSGSRGWAEYYSESGAIFIRIQNVKDTRLELDDVAYVSAPDNAEAKRTKVQPGDLLISITADLGRTCVIPNDIGDAYINQHLALIRLKGISPLYVSNFIESNAGKAQLLKLNRAAVKAGLNFNDIRSLEIPVPPVELQNKFQAKWLRHQQLRRQLLASQNDIQSLFSSLLLESFSEAR